MTSSLPVLAAVNDCWNRIGIRGDRSCPELAQVVHCHNCPVFSAAGQQLLDRPAPPEYLAQEGTRLAAPPEQVATDLLSVLVFRIGEEWLALPVAVLVEVNVVRPVHSVPHRGGLLAGLVNIRGELQLCVVLGKLLGIETLAAEENPAARFLVVQREAERWVFPVDEVDQVWRFPVEELTSLPATVARYNTRLTRGVFHWKGRAIGCLDDARLFQALRTRPWQ